MTVKIVLLKQRMMNGTLRQPETVLGECELAAGLTADKVQLALMRGEAVLRDADAPAQPTSRRAAKIAATA